MSMASERRSEDVDAASPASESRSSSDFETAMHHRHQCRREGRRHRLAQVLIHHQRREGLRALHGDDHVRVYRGAPAVYDDHPASASGTRPHHLRMLPHLPEAPRSAMSHYVQRRRGGERGIGPTPLSRMPLTLSQTTV